ncbi:two-component system sensor histidine kinase DesK [Lipingzhangella halophila]|uniref:Two-component system sensor histidine kinase DesK n=1 Tax=Lipingzhangella halophila TaxID=1783352 RepID=A0A7W7W168_9ACTN|nr:histidine kinase [Lipingzhangella halophila]MBB4929444.1 two-component system sensor histidine kinase DesK [Lipingzhangella halophila]
MVAVFAPAPSDGANPADRFGRRLVLARRVVLASVALAQPGCVLAALGAAAQVWWLESDLPPVASRAPYPFDVVLAAVGVLSSVVLAFLLLRIVRSRIDRPETTLNRDVALSIVVLGGTVAPLGGNNWTIVVAIAWAAPVCVTGSRWRKAGYLLVLLLATVPAPVLLHTPDGGAPRVLLFAGVMSVIVLVTCGLMWSGYASVIVLWDIVTEATAAREAQARLAVSEERLRFARDMHDLLGHSLSGMAVRSELASRLAEPDPQRAAREMATVQQLARDALREVRNAVSGYRDVDLDAEIASVRAVLSAAGVRCAVTAETRSAPVPAEQRTLAAWLVREAATNVLRHSSATRCAVTLRREERTLVAEVYNDGVRGAGQSPVRFGNGLTGLAERAAAAGGTLTASASGANGFLVRAVLPVQDGADSSDAPPSGSEWAANPSGAEVVR